jgi:hypothetical protein
MRFKVSLSLSLSHYDCFFFGFFFHLEFLIALDLPPCGNIERFSLSLSLSLVMIVVFFLGFVVV